MSVNSAGWTSAAALEPERMPRIRSGPPPRNLRRWLPVAGVVLALMISGGCISEEREQAMGDEMAATVNPHLPLIDDPLLDAYVYAVGQTLGEVSARPDLEYHFYVVNTAALNAFALPGGHIYLTRGLIERTRNGPEFAAILAHEIGHVAARHGVRKLQRQLRTGSLVNLLYNTFLGGEPALLRDNSLQLADAVWTASHSRRDEREADRLAIKYLVGAGVDPSAVVGLLETLRDQEQHEGAEHSLAVDWFSSHPLTEDRIGDARRHIASIAGRASADPPHELDAFPAFRLLVMYRASQGIAEISR